MNRFKSHQLFEQAKLLTPGGVHSPVRAFRSVDAEPFMVQRGEGAYLVDEDDNRYVDYINSWGPLVLGHAHPVVTKALQDQITRGTSFGACHKLELELAKLVTSLYPSLEMIRFVNSGTEAGMSVVRLARAFTNRAKIIKFSGCYHGHVDSMLVNAGSGVATLGLPACAGVLQSSAQDTLTAQYNNLGSVEALCSKYQNEIAAIIIEPVVGNAGFIKPKNNFLRELRELTTRNGTLLIFDEVMTGFRVDLRGAQHLYNITPDLTMLGKVIGGGLPVGAFGGRKDIMSLLAPLGPVYQAGTLSGNPLAMTAGIATITEWMKPGTFEKVTSLTTQLTQSFKDAAAKNNIPFCADSLGTMLGFFFHQGPVTNYEEAKQSDTVRFKKLFHILLESGVYIAPSPFEAGFVSLAHEGAPFAHTIQAISAAFSKL
jgi:glutamate-1-semialdehyde 2,1-aminomutase